MEEIKIKNNRKMFLTMLVPVLLVISNIVCAKSGTIFGMVVSASIFVYPFIFLCIALMNEFYGKKEAIRCVILSVVVQLLFLIPSFFISKMNYQSFIGDYYNEINLLLEFDYLIIIGSIIAFSVSQLLNIYIYDMYKSHTHRWIAASVSFIISIFIDTLIFLMISMNAINTDIFKELLFNRLAINIVMVIIIVVIFAISIADYNWLILNPSKLKTGSKNVKGRKK